MNRATLKTVLVILFAVSDWSNTVAEEKLDPKAPHWKARTEDVARWRDMKFGMFVHWGPVTVSGTDLSWGRKSRGRFSPGEIPNEIYDNLYQKFNPVKFDADAWVRIAKSAGMRYIVFTTKHHDGFCNFDTKLTDYKITSRKSPYRKDIVKQLADACHRGGLKLGLYYSQVDWRHPDCNTKNHARYLDYYHGQIKELMSNYGKIDIMWFDCLGYGGYFSRDARQWDADRVFRTIRRLQPHIVINNRCGVPAEFETPEQKLGKHDFRRPWESCIKMAGTHWSYEKNAKVKSLKECVDLLVGCACGDGNLLLNNGPSPDGRIEPDQAKRLAEIGQWLKVSGASIYGTRGGPLPPGTWGGTTYRADTVYVHVLKWPAGRIELSPLEGKIESASLLTGGKVEVEQHEKGVRISVPRGDRVKLDTIVVLKLDRPVRAPRDKPKEKNK